MVIMTDATGCSFIYSDERAIRMAGQQECTNYAYSLERAVEILNRNDRQEVWQIDTEYEEEIRNA